MEGDISGIIFEVLQVLSMILAILTIYFTFKRDLMNRLWYFDIPMYILMVHGLVFYLALFINRMYGVEYPGIYFTSWSTVLRFHGYATLFMIAVFNYLREKNKIRGGCK